MFWPLGSIWVFWKCPYFMTNKAVSSPVEPFVRTHCLRQKVWAVVHVRTNPKSVQ
jgi:hypothetical protein